ncbi:unnamed protein product, partial [Gongylonema pulchrum]|uniref:ZM domain-containing protein n=1 Tax=Gongylonema pulchrum TaxID=637853 RepID=A0A183DC98_9BILA
SHWNVPDNRHFQSENPIGYTHFGYPSQASHPGQASSAPRQALLQTAATQTQASSRTAAQLVHNPETYPLSFQEYVARHLPRTHILQATQDSSESEEDGGHPENPIAQQLTEQAQRIHSSNPVFPAPSSSLIREMLQRSLEAQLVLPYLHRQLPDSVHAAQRKPEETDEETSDSDDNQQVRLDHLPGTFDSAQKKHSYPRYSFAGVAIIPGYHASTGYDARHDNKNSGDSRDNRDDTRAYNVSLSRSNSQYSDQWIKQQATALCRTLATQLMGIPIPRVKSLRPNTDMQEVQSSRRNPSHQTPDPLTFAAKPPHV